jgi:hypothetical protein
MAQGQQWLSVVIFTDGGNVATPANILVLSAASPPPRPTPVPPDPGTGQPPLIIWGPGDPRPTLPIAGWDPIHGTFPPGPVTPPGGGGGDLPPQVIRPPSGETPGVGVVRNAVQDPAAPPATPPADMPGAVLSDVYFGRGTLPARAWIGPYAAQQK